MVNSAYILIGSFVLLVLAVGWLTLRTVLLVLAGGWLTLRRMGYVIIRPRNELHRRLSEPRTHGDDGGYPVVKGRVEIIPR